MKKRIVSTLLAVMMLLSLVPLSVSAEEITYTDEYILESYNGLPQFRYVYPDAYNSTMVVYVEDKWGAFNFETQEWVIKPEYINFNEMCGIFLNGMTFFTPADKQGYVVLDIQTGDLLIDDSYTYDGDLVYVGMDTLLGTDVQDKSIYLFNAAGRVKVGSGSEYWSTRAFTVASNEEQRLVQLTAWNDAAMGNVTVGTFHIDETGKITSYTGEFTEKKVEHITESVDVFGMDYEKNLPYVEEVGSNIRKYINVDVGNGNGNYTAVLNNGIVIQNGENMKVGRLVRGTSSPEMAPGTPIGDVLYTDIVAYIDDKPIRSYNIAGNTYIVVEDLAAYGFDVQWIAEGSGKLVVGTTRTAAPDGYTTTYVPEKNTHPAGSVAMQYLYTNITAWLGDAQVTGYNIGGFTCIGMDDLANTFATNYVWDGVEGALRLYTQP